MIEDSRLRSPASLIAHLETQRELGPLPSPTLLTFLPRSPRPGSEADNEARMGVSTGVLVEVDAPSQTPAARAAREENEARTTDCGFDEANAAMDAWQETRREALVHAAVTGGIAFAMIGLGALALRLRYPRP